VGYVEYSSTALSAHCFEYLASAPVTSGFHRVSHFRCAASSAPSQRSLLPCTVGLEVFCSIPTKITPPNPQTQREIGGKRRGKSFKETGMG